MYGPAGLIIPKLCVPFYDVIFLFIFRDEAEDPDIQFVKVEKKRKLEQSSQSESGKCTLLTVDSTSLVMDSFCFVFVNPVLQT